MRRLAIVSLLGVCGLGAAPAVLAATFTVDTAAGSGIDQIPGDGICATSSGECSLLAAVMEANAWPGLDTIAFAVGGGGAVATIAPLEPLPIIADPVVIDGATQACPPPGPCIELVGNLIPTSHGLEFSVGGNTVRGLAIGFFDTGVFFQHSDGNLFEGNHFGTDATGTVARGNEYGIRAWYSENTLIGGFSPEAGNRFAANGFGIRLFDCEGSRILSNVIGGDVAIPAELFNYWEGIHIGGRGHVVIGAPGAGNVISGNRTGVTLSGSLSAENLVQSNCIGPILGCTTPFGNEEWGIVLSSAPNNTIGGTGPGEGNVIGSNKIGIGIANDFGTDNTIIGNFIGTDPTGTLLLGNDHFGVHLGGDDNVVGGLEPGAGNLIMNTESMGIRFAADGNVVRGNSIASNGRHGVFVLSGVGNRVEYNTISSSGELGIALANDGVTPNDPWDLDTGPNDLQNYPVLGGAVSNGATTTFSGWLYSTPDSVFELEFFANEQCNPSSHGEGASLLGRSTVATDSSGGVYFTVSFAVGTPQGRFITATATNLGGSTSEFSACFAVGDDEVAGGACCFSNGNCILTTEVECDGVYQGDGTFCEFDRCVAEGACCFTNGGCVVTTEAECAGEYQGDGTVCEDGLCPVTEGACCLSDRECVVTTHAECAGDYQGDGTICGPDTCSDEVPAVSEWGLILSALVLLGLGAVLLRSRRASPSS